MAFHRGFFTVPYFKTFETTGLYPLQKRGIPFQKIDIPHSKIYMIYSYLIIHLV